MMWSVNSVSPHRVASNSTAPRAPVSGPAAVKRSPSWAAAASAQLAPSDPASMSEGNRRTDGVTVQTSIGSGARPIAGPLLRS